MDYKELLDAVCEYVNEQLEEEKAVITTNIKNNGVKLSGITVISKNVNASPTIYMENFYLDYLKGTDICEIGDKVIEIFRNSSLSEDFDINFFSEYEKVKDRFLIKLINYEQNRDFLEGVPFERIQDLAVVAYCFVDDRIIGKGAITVKNEHVQMWKVSGSEVIKQAKINSVNNLHMRIRHIAEILREIDPFQESEYEDELDNFKMFVVSSDDGINGAVFLTMPDKLREMGEVMGSDFYIIPSSIHELILIPSEGSDAENLEYMIREVNENHVGREEVLANHAYYYSRADETLIF